MFEKKIEWTERTYQHGKKVIIIHYEDGTTRTVVSNPLQ